MADIACPIQPDWQGAAADAPDDLSDFDEAIGVIGADGSRELWCNCTVVDGVLTLQDQENVTAVVHLGSGLYKVLFAITFSDLEHFEWSPGAASSSGPVFLWEVERTASSITVQTSNLYDAERWGIDVRGHVATVSGDSGQSGSGSGDVVYKWYCLIPPADPDGVCLRLTEAQLADKISDGYTQSSGPHDTSAECVDACSIANTPITVPCCAEAVPSLLKMVTGDNFGMACATGGEIVLIYQGLVDSGNPDAVGDVHMWTGGGFLGSCGHSVSVRFYCGTHVSPCSNTMNAWFAEIVYDDDCNTGGPHQLNTCNGGTPLVSCDPFHFHGSATTGIMECGGTTSANAYDYDIIPV